ncbi:MAG: hypothetical protein J2P29_09585 [Actinobacteria bacterium]|nr:hypothetical protein [Actinomycetota bacterium]
MTSTAHAAPALPGADKAVVRWKLGHHLFHLHLTTMNSLLAQARDGLESACWPELAHTLEQLRVLYDAATATMRYAADFSQDMYERLIRPSMAPPFASPGFSGVLNLEHAQMIDQFRELRRQLKGMRRAGQTPAAVEEAAARLFAAQARNRRSHILVCESCVPDGTSLLREFLRDQERADPQVGEPAD